MSLINGMEDIITHIKNQETRIKALQQKNRTLTQENQKLKEEHNKFDEIWKTEGITEQDIIDMKRQISNQCVLIKELKEFKQEAEDTCASSIVMESMMDKIQERDQVIKGKNDRIKLYEEIREKEKYKTDFIDCLILKIVTMSSESEFNDGMSVGEEEDICVTYDFLGNKHRFTDKKERDNFEELINEIFNDLNIRDWNDDDRVTRLVCSKLSKDPMTNDFGFSIQTDYLDLESDDL